MAFFRGDFSSASAATLINGEWTEEQLFESSISSFGDATSHQGLAYACLLTSADHAAIMSETDLGAGFSSIDRVVTDSTASIQNCRMDTAGNELSAVFVDSNEELFRGTGTLGSTGLDPQSWSSESVASGLNRRFDYAATEGAYAIVYRNDDTGENLVHWNRSGTVESQVLLEGANMGYPMAFFDEGGSLYVATTGSVDGESGLGFYRICAE